MAAIAPRMYVEPLEIQRAWELVKVILVPATRVPLMYTVAARVVITPVLIVEIVEAAKLFITPNVAVPEAAVLL
ncbi:hypothetical protein ON010_g10687 [Phytophthora cinnamomi]|nr:hypothetical protein ON010_g10687 [Phytophthora cinnamomi]